MEQSLSNLERDILQIALELIKSKKTITLQKLYYLAKKKSKESSEAISSAIYQLTLKKYIIPGTKMTKNQVLLNEKRNKIYGYIIDRPGCHLNEIKQFMNIKGQLIKWHLLILEKFGYIYSQKYLKYLNFFPYNFKRNLIIPYLSLKHPLSYKILLTLMKHPLIHLNNLKELMHENFTSLKYQLEKLIDSGVVKIQYIHDIKFYYVNEELLMALQTYLKISEEELELFLIRQKERFLRKDDISKLTVEAKMPPIKEPSEKEELVKEQIRILREYDYVGGDIRFKIAVQNISNIILSEINVTLIPSTQYEIDEKVKSIPILKPGESRGIDFKLTPLTCGRSQVYGSVSYVDAFGNPSTITIRPKEIWIKCPLVVPKKQEISTLEELKSNLSKGSAIINFQDMPASETFQLVREQISALDLSEVTSDPLQYSVVYAGMAKVTSNDLIIEAQIKPNQIVINVWTNDMKQATGFLAYLKNMIVLSLKSIKTLKGKIDKISKKIIDASNVINSLEKVCTYCEENWTKNDLMLSLKESLKKIEQAFPDIQCIDQINSKIEFLEEQFREGEVIDQKTSIELEYYALEWLNIIYQIAQNNLELYKETFPEENEKIAQLTILLKMIREKIEKRERLYAIRIPVILLFIYKLSGITLYEYKFRKTDLPPDLISGFLSAIQSFGTELSKEETSMKKIAYKNMEIEIISGQYLVCAILVDGTMRPYLRDILVEFTNELEKQYESELKNWTGDVTPFQKLDIIFEKYFLKSPQS
ncbi:MAG: hypothetical protein ACTSYB_05255 [Candidatus Helarchaeota archaeon]